MEKRGRPKASVPKERAPGTGTLISEALSRAPFPDSLKGPLGPVLAPIATPLRVKAGNPIFGQDDTADSVYLVARGKVRVYIPDPSGKERTLRIMGPGETFGEAAVFMDGGYPASSSALADSWVLRFPKGSLLGAIRDNPALAFAVIGVMAGRLRELTTLLGATLKEVGPRLAGYLLSLPENEGKVRLPTTKVELARHLGTSPESLSRALGRLKADGLVREHKSYLIRILDREGLEAFALG
ncbi:MAG: Crp/Fnr family transcriptional regulator [Deltaproteobacteria bacterium]|jgi:CRP/FNR family transcriptional regulator|nr:Crp/Fnr family transcriptional regulator [Deltaproteobacteria bacterium]